MFALTLIVYLEIIFRVLGRTGLTKNTRINPSLSIKKTGKRYGFKVWCRANAGDAGAPC